jgi:hypothetical protein
VSDPIANAIFEGAIVASALLMREVVCEQIYRQRAAWSPDHPNKALGVRSIDPAALIPYVRPHLLGMTPDELKAEAARVLDLITAPKAT